MFVHTDSPGRPRVEGLRIRAMTYRDLGVVAAIEGLSFSAPWRASSFARVVSDSNQRFFVAELDRQVIGYGGFWVERQQAHVAKVAVHPEHRRRGIGSAILDRLLNESRRMGLAHAYLEVRKSNTAAQALYERFGFRFERVQPNAYPDDGEDALIYLREDLLATSPPESKP
jgi:ribosomal-protein-alanine N-acetyltransferase